MPAKAKDEKATEESDKKSEKEELDISSTTENKETPIVTPEDKEEKTDETKKTDVKKTEPAISSEPTTTTTGKTEAKTDTETDTGLPKVASFSQLDTNKKSSEVLVPDEVKKSQEETVDNKMKEKKEEDVAKEEAPKSDEKEQMEPTNEEVKAEDEKEGDVSSDEIKEWLKDVRPDTSKEMEKGGSFNFKKVIVIILVFAVLGAIVGGIFYYRQGVEESPSETADESMEAMEEPTPTPTVTPEPVDLTIYSVSVLNGSGVRGEAGRVSQLLSDAGFEADNIDAGNANNTNYESTIVSIKEDIPDGVYDTVTKSLEDEFDVEKSETALEEDSEFDVIIIVGTVKETSEE